MAVTTYIVYRIKKVLKLPDFKWTISSSRIETLEIRNLFSVSSFSKLFDIFDSDIRSKAYQFNWSLDYSQTISRIWMLASLFICLKICFLLGGWHWTDQIKKCNTTGVRCKTIATTHSHKLYILKPEMWELEVILG